MYKLGSEKDIQKGQIRMWGYDVVRLWLVKDLAVRKYARTECYKVLGLCKDEENKCRGWCTVYCGKLTKARRIMEDYD